MTTVPPVDSPRRRLTPILVLRSLAFGLGMALSTLVIAPSVVLLAPFPLTVRDRLISIWATFNIWWLAVCCRLVHEVEGLENIPEQPCLVLSKHESAWETIADFLGLGDVGTVQIILSALVVVWVFGLLYVIYRFGPPVPLERPAITAGVVTVVLVIGTQIAVAVSPEINSQALAVFGTMGVLLVWLYGVGIVVVSVPMMVEATRAAIGDLKHG